MAVMQKKKLIILIQQMQQTVFIEAMVMPFILERIL